MLKEMWLIRRLSLYFSPKYIDLLFAMAKREIKVRYKKVVFGFFWLFVNSFLQLFVVSTVFRYVLNQNYFTYLPYLFIGLLINGFVSQTLNQTTGCFIANRQLLHKANFPKEIIVLSIVLTNTIQLLLSFVIVLIISVFLQQLMWQSIFIVIAGLLILELLIIGLSLFLATLSTSYRNIQYLVQVTLPLWFYGTPILYSLDMLPQQLQSLFYLNPLTSILEMLRILILHNYQINVMGVISAILTSCLIFIIGIITYKKHSAYLIDKL